MSERQTLSFLSRRFEQFGLQPKTKYGQNFLIDLNLLDMLHSTARLDNHDVVLEIGTGLGSLTTRMAPRAGWVVTIEIDSQLQQMAGQELREFQNITLLTCDALRNKNNLREEILEEVRQRMIAIPNARFKLVANLPYNIATPIISNLLMVDPRPDCMVVTIQKELAERIVAVPSTKEYSALSIWMQSQCDCRIVRVMPPSVFWPRPNVDSAILEIVPNAKLRERIQDLGFFHNRLRALFFHRRKFIRSQLAIAFQDILSKQQIDSILLSLSIDQNVRAEQLPVERIIELLEACRQASVQQI
ncbi:MAG: 16S rRNA (adenine(1518)-N(6)/adenine(1519)-N(6))-dimethyltransferase RsmA [Pirellulaceae bacterium]|nr:16S rRNA (adenine(1518)-N(6)/adenine(1519)-N(6))-dimethyltransferase RsmA [Pirellulaceae bacterium]